MIKRRKIPTLECLETRNLLSVVSPIPSTAVTLKTAASMVSVPGIAGATNVLATLNSTLGASLANGASLTDVVTENISISVSMSGVVTEHATVSPSLQAVTTSGGNTKTNVLANFRDVLAAHLTPGSSLNETVTETITISVSMSGVVSDSVNINSVLNTTTGIRPIYVKNLVDFHIFQNQREIGVVPIGDGWISVFGDPKNS